MQLNSQQQADIALARWQSRRDLTPEQRIEIAFYDMIVSVPKISMAEYEAQQKRVTEEMAHV